MSCSSTSAVPLAPDKVCLTVTKTMAPVEPVLGSIDLISETRRAVSPMRSGSPSKNEAAARPHAARQRDRRQELAALAVAVRPDLRRRSGLEEIEPVPERRQGIAHAGLGIGARRGSRSAPGRARGRRSPRRFGSCRPSRANYPVPWCHRGAILTSSTRGGKGAPCCYKPARHAKSGAADDHVRRSREGLRAASTSTIRSFSSRRTRAGTSCLACGRPA